MNSPKAVLTAMLLLGLAAIGPPAAGAKVLVGRAAGVLIESPALPPDPQMTGATWRHVLTHPDATFLKVRFARLTLGTGARLRIIDGAGRAVVEYTGPLLRTGLWAPAIMGERLVLDLQAGGAAGVTAVAVDRYGYGVRPPFLQSICGSDETEDVACYAGTALERSSRAVGRMLFEVGADFFACTGFLVSAQDHFLSAQHCLSTQTAVDSLEVRFDFELADCGGQTLKAFASHSGDRLLASSERFDFSLMTLHGRPSATYGFLPLSPRDQALGESLYLPQHPGGGPKKISVTGCMVSAEAVDGDGPNSDFGHQCDTQPGSSGSPVLDLQHRVVGLHRVGGCSTSAGRNQAVRMSQILPLLPMSLEFVAGSLGCGDAGCMDSWKIACRSPRTRCVIARGCAEGVSSAITTSAIGYAPPGTIGRGGIATGPPGGCTPDVEVCRDGPGPMKAIMVISAPSGGGTAYTAFAGCVDEGGSLLPPAARSVAPVVDQ